MQGTKWLTVSAVAGLVFASGCCTTCEKPMKVTSVPPAAQKMIDQYAAGGTVHEVEMKKEHDMTLYEAKVKESDGSKLEILVNADGKLYKLERKEHKHE